MRIQILVIIMMAVVVRALAQDSNFHIYLCFGQSNMEGSAAIEKQDQVENKRFLTLQPLNCKELSRNKGKWYPAIPPLSQCHVGLSPADYFGRTMAESLPKNIKVGVINIAVGGCDIRLFDKDLYKNYRTTYKEDWFRDKVKNYGNNPYGYLIKLAKEAQKDGMIKGILLHQGETNTGDENWTLYVKKIYEDMLIDLSLKAVEVPLLVGEVVHEEQEGVCAKMNSIINNLPKVIPTSHVISSKGCGVRKDKVHFNSEGVRELGKRYAKKMLAIKER